MAQDKPVNEMQPADLTEEFRLASEKRGSLRARGAEIDNALVNRTDILEQEILRRMAW